MATTYDKAQKQLPQDLSALGNLKVNIAENTAAGTDQDVNVVAVAGTPQTARNWSDDFAKLDIALSALRDALKGAGNKDLSTIETELATILNEATFTGRVGEVQASPTANTILDRLKVVRDQLDVVLSTRLAEVTFTARINTQGQKAMAASTPVVIASDQSAFPVTNQGLELTLTPADPSAGAGLNLVITDDMIIYGVDFTLVTDANTANRRAYMQIIDKDDTVQLSVPWVAPTTIPASTTKNFTVQKGAVDETTIHELRSWGGATVKANQRFKLSIDGMQAGDQLSTIAIKGVKI